MLTLYFAAPKDWPEYQTALPLALSQAGIAAHIVTDAPENPAEVDYIIYAPYAPLQDFAPYTGCKAVLSLWAGVERVVGNATLTQPLCRMVEDGLTEGMVEYVTGHVLRYHLGMDQHIQNPARAWNPAPPPLARERRVAMLGMGALGSACARALRALNFNVAGWSRSGGALGDTPIFSGREGLRRALEQADVIVTLLPKTPQTENLLNAETLSWAPHGARLINPGRGALIDDAALLAALGSGQIAHATLDVFRTEPLPPDHAFWGHPNITITPHIAADTRADGAARALAENIRRGEAGQPLLYLVQRTRGY
ncbi:MAG: glyoxylate/hydroxypyruvate reductase A [Cypionkella sp.]|nr:glyoxylate/hydroxypyruvate reductase A [Cypionkella sp.]